jgi:primosomal protein DnaI
MAIKESSEIIQSIGVPSQAAKQTDALLKAFGEDKPVADKIRSLKLSRAQVKENIGLISDYKDDVDYCAHCPGLAGCHKANPFYQSDLIVKDGMLSRTYGPCERFMHQQTILGAYVCRDFPDEWIDNNLDTISKTDRENSLMAVLFGLVPNNRWAYLIGDIGSGRSYLTAAFCNSMALGGLRVAFMNANKRFDELKGLAVNNKRYFDQRIKDFETVPFLVIDDFGSEFKSDYVRDQIVIPILLERAKRNLPIIFISDYHVNEIQTLYSTNRSAELMASKMAKLISSRIGKETQVAAGTAQTFINK